MHTIRCSLFIIAMILTGCANLNNEKVISYSPAPSIVMHAYHDDLQNAFFKLENSPVRFCLEPSPDAAASYSSGISLSDTNQDTIGFNSSVNDVALGGRGDMVLISRELMYRACEFAANTNSDPEKAWEIYKTFLEAIISISANMKETRIIKHDDE